MKILSFTVYLSLALPFMAVAQIDFKPAMYPPALTNPAEMVSGDFDGNGLPDMLVNFEPRVGMAIFYTQPSAPFTTKKFKITSGKARSSQVAVGDLNNDGKDDLVIVDEEEVVGGKVLVCFSTGTEFDIQTLTDIDASLWQVEIVDFDSDGYVDVILGGHLKWMYLKGDGSGNFSSSPVEGWPAKEDDQDFEILDVNHDGQLDFVSVRFNRITTWHASNSGYVAKESVYVGNPTASIFADFNGDELPDLVIITSNVGNPSKMLYFINDGDSNFLEPTEIPTAISYPGSLDHSDYDGDGWEDIVVGNLDPGLSFILLHNDGDGFSQDFPQDNQSGGTAGTLFTDLDNEGTLEIVSVSWQGTIRTFRLTGSHYLKVDDFAFSGTSLDGKVYDLDNDGNNDIIGASINGSAQVWYGKVDGNFEDPMFFMLYGKAYAVDIADLNGDGYGDIVLGVTDGYIGGRNSVSVLLSNGERSFDDFHEVLDLSVGMLLLADVNGDDTIDIITDEQILTNDGHGVFEATIVDFAPGIVSSAVGTFNADGFPDLAIVAGEELYVALNDGSGAFPSFNTLSFTSIQNILSVKAVDLDGDEYSDLVSMMRLQTGEYVIVTLTSNHDGSFSEKRMLLLSGHQQVFGVDAGDIDHDDIVDIVTQENGSVISVYTGNDDGTYDYANSFSTEDDVYRIAVARTFLLKDVNKDSWLDVVIFTNDEVPVAVFEGNRIVEPTVAPSAITVVTEGVTATISLTKGDGNGRLILIRKKIFIEESSDPSEKPEDGIFYDQTIGKDSVVMAGDETSVTVDGLSPLSKYNVFAYEYNANERNTVINYLPTVATTQFTTKAAPLTTGLEEQDSGYFISPNPATNVVRIQGSENFTIHNSIGLAFELPYAKRESEIEVNVASLPPGLYLVKLNGVTLKLIKQ